MIIVKLTGGMGNQLFQYALGRRLAIKNNSRLKLDISGFETYKLHDYTLGNFNIVENIASPVETFLFKKPIGKLLKTYVEETSLQFHPKVLDTGPNAYLEGYWQSEKYFLDIEDVIRREFTLRDGLGSEAARIAGLIASGDSVSLHVRRGDYATNERTNKTHGLCPPEYYYRALKIVGGKIKNLKLFVFSDDINWVKENLDLDNLPVTYVSDGNVKIKNYEELVLMSLCAHNIIANSTFSWWGAWLNRKPNKIVIAPQNWFADQTNETGDLLPRSWVTA